jgi:hypothetical protein
MTAGTIAKERFEQYLEEKLQDGWDKTEWEFYDWLLEQAKRHKPDYSGYGCSKYLQDKAEAKRRNSQVQMEEWCHGFEPSTRGAD